MIRQILQSDARILREVARPVATFGAGLEALAADMLETLRHAKGIGLAAPQVGVALRLIVVEVAGMVCTMANPVILSRAGQQRVQEGCLSVPRSLWGQPVSRAARICVEYYGTDGMKRQWSTKGLRAACIQHECDHLDGILFTDRVYRRAT